MKCSCFQFRKHDSAAEKNACTILGCVETFFLLVVPVSMLFVIFRPHWSGGCFQTGYVDKGVPKFDRAISSSCPTGPPRGGEWFQVKLTVSTATPLGEVKVYLKGTLVRSWNPRYKIINRGGVLVANGYKNVVHFKNFRIQ